MQEGVLVMASGGKPLRRMLMGISDRVFYLANPEITAAVEAGESEPVGFPQEDVFEFDEAIFTALADQWARRRATDPAIWRKLKRYAVPA